MGKLISPVNHQEYGHLILLNVKVNTSIFSELSSLPLVVTRSDGLVVRASASGAVDPGLIPSRVKPVTLKLLFTASLLDAQH